MKKQKLFKDSCLTGAVIFGVTQLACTDLPTWQGTDIWETNNLILLSFLHLLFWCSRWPNTYGNQKAKEYIAVTLWFSVLGGGGSNFVLRDIFVCHNSGRKVRGANGFQWVEARHSAKLPPTTKKYLSQTVTSANCEKP